MQPIGPSLPPSPSSQVMMTRPLFWYCDEFKMAGRFAASQSSVCFTGLFVGPHEAWPSLQTLGVMKLEGARVVPVMSLASSVNGRITAVHAGLTDVTTSSKNAKGLWR